MKAPSQEDRGSECLSLTRWKSLCQSADDYKIVDILFSQPRNGKVLLRDASVRAQLLFAAINSVLLWPVNISCSSEIVNPNVSVGGE